MLIHPSAVCVLCALCASQESPERGFLPASGLLAHLQPPAEVEGRVRVDTGVRAGDHVSVFYDPMIAKLIVWGEDRRKALKALAHALESFQIGGVPTNIPFLHSLATHPTFVSAGDEVRPDDPVRNETKRKKMR